jgi:hypothetical protein
MGFVDRYIHALSASSLQDDARHSQAEPLLAAALASVSPGDLGALLHRAKYAGTTTQDMAKALEVRTHVEKELAEAIRKKDVGREAECRQALQGDATALETGVAQVAHLLRVWTAEVTKRGRARRWVPENTAWDAAAAIKLYRTVAEHSLAHWLGGGGPADLALSAGFVREHVLNMVSELHGIAGSHAARAGAKMRTPQPA